VTTQLLDIPIKATVLLASAGIADALLWRRGSAAARHLVWSIAVAALLVLPVASSALPQWTVRIPIAPAAVAAPATDGVSRLGSGPSSPVTAIACNDPGLKACATTTDVAPPAANDVSGVMPLTLFAALVAVYAAGLILLLVRLIVEPVALRRLTRASRNMTDQAWRARLDEAAVESGVTTPVRLLQSAREVMPLTFGTLAPTIVLPASADEWPDDRRRAVLLHELAHVARRDCLVQRLTALVCAIYWPHPGVWWAARRLRAERELACDDRVLAAGAGAREYAGHLLELAHSLGSAPAPATTLSIARARQLESRLLAVLDAARNRAALHTRGRAIALAIAIAVLIPLAALRAAVVPRGIPTSERLARGSAAALSTQSADLSGTWELRLSRGQGVVHVTVRTDHGSHGRTVRLDQLPGVTAAQISASSSTIRIPIRREAGTFNVEGVCHRGVCAGTYTFEPSQTFASQLAARGLANPTPQEQMELALADTGIAFLDTLAANGYARPDLPGVIRATRHGIDTGYVRDMASLGYRVGTVDDLVRLRDHGVDPDYVRGMAAGGFRDLSVTDLVRARDHGVDPAYVNGMRDLGYRISDLASLVSTRDHGVDPVYVRGMQERGYRLDLEDMTRMRDHGVDPEFVNGLATLGYDGLTVDALLRARDHGVDPHYVREMAELGYKGVTLDALIRMRDHGIDAAYVRRVQQRGLSHLSVDEMIERRDRGMDDPDAAARAVVSQVESLWHSIVIWLRS